MIQEEAAQGAAGVWVSNLNPLMFPLRVAGPERADSRSEYQAEFNQLSSSDNIQLGNQNQTHQRSLRRIMRNENTMHFLCFQRVLMTYHLLCVRASCARADCERSAVWVERHRCPFPRRCQRFLGG